MRRISIVVLALAVPLILPAAAWAPDHRTRVTEVKLADGDSGFVELQDSAQEPFPSLSYHLSIFGADGTAMGTVDVDKSMLINNTEPHAFTVDALPPGAGQVCFTRGMGGSDHIHCVAYGCPASPIASEGGTNSVTAPAPGQSVQRQADGKYQFAGPTRGAPNASGADAACSGGGGGGGGGGGAPDTVAPDQFLAYEKKQDLDKLAITLTLNEAASVTVKGSVNVPGAAVRLKLKTVKRDLAPNVRRKFRLKLRPPALRRVRNALDDGRKLKAAVQISAEDSAGNSSTERPRIKLKD